MLTFSTENPRSTVHARAYTSHRFLWGYTYDFSNSITNRVLSDTGSLGPRQTKNYAIKSHNLLVSRASSTTADTSGLLFDAPDIPRGDPRTLFPPQTHLRVTLECLRGLYCRLDSPSLNSRVKGVDLLRYRDMLDTFEVCRNPSN